MSGQIIETIQPGNKYTYAAPGNSFACYAATAELTFSVWVGANYYDGLPLDRGTGFKAPFDRVEVYNNTAAPVTVTLIFLQIPNMPIEGFYDQRELAAQVAVDGGIVTNTAPEIDNGGTVLSVGNSNRELNFNQTGLGDGNVVIIDAVSNTSGVRIRHLELLIYSTNATKDTASRMLIAYSPLAYLDTFVWKSASQPSVYSYDKTLDLAPGARLEMFLRDSDHVLARINYDHL